ncbi:MAG: UDP-3-O-acyl-N-acetylglucosamine deacetylase [Fimbriimonadales bacterium]|nr:UDP-3-O-acyl-N-acetylglucosamine deacetylase [Fimbriimonadales bacterium]
METVSTLRETLYFEGVGLHTGERCRVALHLIQPHPPTPPLRSRRGRSIATPSPFTERGLGSEVQSTHIILRKGNHTFPARWDYVIDTTRATVLGDGGVKISTVEHLMAALWMTGITHCVIEVLEGNEIPILDGSALPFVEAICEATHAPADPANEPHPPCPPLRKRRGGNAYPAIAHGSPSPFTERGLGGEVFLQARHTDRYLALSLEGNALIGYIQFPEPLGVQAGAFSLENALTEVAPARTFGFLREVEALRAQGLALGGALENALVIDETGYHNPARFEDEPLRHKLLDALGDLYLSGVFLRRFTLVAVKPGHALNVQLARTLAQRFHAED